MAISTQRRMTEKEIQAYEAGDEQQVTDYLMKLTQLQVVTLFLQLLRSYRDAARVANAAWRVLDESKKNGSPSQETYQRLVDALQLYAPMNFAPTQYAHEFAISILAGVHDTMAKFPTVPEATAWVGEYIKRLAEARWFQGGAA